MIISERIIKVLKERNMTQAEFAKQVGISTSTISEWKKRKTNPTVEKIMFCKLPRSNFLPVKELRMKRKLLQQVQKVNSLQAMFR